MANTDAPRGAWPVKHMSGGTIRANEYPIASGYSTNIFKGDFVKLVAGGGIEAAAAGDRLLGVFQGVQYTASDGEVIFKKYWPASTVTSDAVAYVYDDKNIVYGIQQATGGSVAAADVGQIGDHVAGTGSTLTGMSGHELSATLTASVAAGLRVLGKLENPGNVYGEHCDVLVQIYEHEFSVADNATVPGV